MSSSVNYTKAGVKVECNTSIQPRKRAQQQWPIPTFPGTANSFLTLGLVSVAGAGSQGVSVATTCTLPGPWASWILYWMTYQGSMPNSPTWQAVPVPGLSISITLTVSPASTFVAYLHQDSAGQTLDYAQATLTTPADSTYTGVTGILSVDVLANSDKITLMQQWQAEAQTQAGLHTGVTAAGLAVSTYAAYDAAITAISTGLIAAGAVSNWASVWPDGTSLNSVGIITSLKSWWATVANQRQLVTNAIAGSKVSTTGGTLTGSVTLTGSLTAAGGSFTRSSNVAALGATNTTGASAWFAGKLTAAPDTLSTIANLNGSLILTDETGQVGMQMGACSNLGYGSYIQTRWMTSVTPPTDLYLNPSGGNVVIGPGNLSATIQRLGYGTYANNDSLTFYQRNAYGVSFGRTSASDCPIPGNYFNYMLLPEVQGAYSQSILALGEGVDSYIGQGNYAGVPSWQKILTPNNVNNSLASIIALTGLSNCPVACTNATVPTAIGMNGKYIWVIDDTTYNTNKGVTTGYGTIYKSNGSNWVWQDILPNMVVGSVAASSISAQALAANVALINNVICSGTFTSGGAGGFLGVPGNNTGITSGWAIYDQARPCKMADGTPYNAIAEFGAGVLINNWPAETLTDRLFNNSQTWTTPGTYSWTPPKGCSLVQVIIMGGGGSGASGRSGAGGGGGGAGAFARIFANVTSGTPYTVRVGAGGAAPALITAGNDGTYSAFQTDLGLLYCGGGRGGGNTAINYGGNGGKHNSTSLFSPTGSTVGGTAGLDSISGSSYAYTTWMDGAGGGANFAPGGACDLYLGGSRANTTVYCGGGGGASPMSNGGNGNQNQNGTAGGIGAGGGGGGDTSYTGGAGGGGYIKLIW